MFQQINNNSLGSKIGAGFDIKQQYSLEAYNMIPSRDDNITNDGTANLA